MANILLLDDSEELLEMFQLIFIMNGYNVCGVDDKNKLMLEIEKCKPDLFILDVHLRESNGREICKELKSQEATKYIPIILMSASPKNLESYEECMADAILSKPFNLADLIMQVNSLLNHSVQH